MDLNTLKNSELLELYNKHADKKVARFTDRKTALRRVGDLIASMKAHGCDDALAAVTADTEHKPAPAVQPEPSPEHKYVSLLRPVTFASLPEGVRWDYFETPSDGHVNRPDLPASWHKFGAIMLSRALTEEEMSHFDVVPYTAAPARSETFQQPITMPTLPAPQSDAPKAKGRPRAQRDWTVKPVITSPTNQHVTKLLDRIEAARGNADALRAITFKGCNTYYKMARNYLDALLAEVSEQIAA